jgi:hypothetical protein
MVLPLLGIDRKMVGCRPKVLAESIIVDRLPGPNPALGAVVVIVGKTLGGPISVTTSPSAAALPSILCSIFSLKAVIDR